MGCEDPKYKRRMRKESRERRGCTKNATPRTVILWKVYEKTTQEEGVK